MKNKIISIFIFSLLFITGYAQQNLTISTNGTPQSYVNSLAEGCMEISNITYTGAANAIGSFTNGESLGIDEGVIMSTGNVNDAVGPNSGTATATNNLLPGDPTFDNHFGVLSTDAAVLEFDFIPHSGLTVFTFIFASDGYPETENSGAYDGLGIFITGPIPIAGNYLDSNIATIPSTLDYININTLNLGTNDYYYVDNSNGLYCEYDGYSIPIQKTLFTVPCQSYHMKIVIADVHPMFDSAVLMGAESLSSDFMLLANNYSQSGELDDISESCTNTLVLSRVNQLDSLPFPFECTITGTSTEGVDFVGISSGLYEIPFMESYISFDYTAILDNVTEGIETIIFTFTHPSICDSACYASYSIEIDIIDNYPLVAGIVQSDTGICSVNTTYLPLDTYIPSNMDPNTVYYEWSNGSTDPSIVAEPSSGMQSEYCVTITDICDQVVVDCITVTNSDFSGIQLATTDNLCYGEEFGVVEVSTNGGNAPFNYQWDPVYIGNDSVNIIDDLPAGYYGVTVTDTIGCNFDAGFLIDSPDSIFYSVAVFEPKCHDGTDGSISFQMFQGVPPYSYQWSSGQTTAGLDSIVAGNYILIAVDMNGCEIEVPVIISEPDQLVLSASSDVNICLGQTVPLMASVIGGTPSYYYSWSDGATGPNTSVTPSVSSIYTVQVTDINGCVSNIENVTVNIYPAISVQLYTTDDSLCTGDETSIYADIQGGTGGPYMAVFSNGASSDILPPPYVVSPQNTTVYEVLIEDFCGSPVGLSSLTISVFEPPLILIEPDVFEGCKPLTVNFQDLNYEDGNEYHWHYNDGTNELLSHTAFPTHIFANYGLYDITVDVTSKVGCKNTITSEELINVFPIPVARFHSNPEIASIIKPIIFFENVSDQPFISTWDFGDGSEVSNSESPEHIFNAVGEYNITLNIENEFGCIDEFSQTIIIRNEYTFYIPNAFSPGSAFAQNRLFKPVGEGIDPYNFHMIIYNRWGMKIYETFDLNHPWNGEINGKPAELGASFPWVIIYKDMNGEEHQESGSVTIVE